MINKMVKSKKKCDIKHISGGMIRFFEAEISNERAILRDLSPREARGLVPSRLDTALDSWMQMPMDIILELGDYQILDAELRTLIAKCGDKTELRTLLRKVGHKV